jgi:hypothetical protein
MRLILTSLTAALLVAAPALAGGRRHAAAVSAPRGEVAISFESVTAGGADALFDAGVTSQARKAPRHTFGIRVQGGAAQGTATLRAALESFDGRCTIRIDGIELGTAPKIIAARVPLGSITTHTLEIVVPPAVPEGAFASSVRWEATTND